MNAKQAIRLAWRSWPLMLGLLGGGCIGLNTARPNGTLGRLDLEAQRKDFVALNAVEGASKERCSCLGSAPIVDDHK